MKGKLMNTEQKLKAHIESYTIPELDLTIQQLSGLKEIQVSADQVRVQLQFGFPVAHFKQQIITQLHEQLSQLMPQATIEVEVSSRIHEHQVAKGTQAIANVKNIIAVASGKGGVGKSTTTVNLALALASQGARVGILDADIHGPNQPHMLGTNSKPDATPQKQFIPVMAHGLQTMSIGYLIDATAPAVWRGPMVSQALKQLLFDTVWDNLDYLLIDMPPGTGDIQLTLAKSVPVSGAVIVTTPQDISLLDARKGFEMFRKVNVPVLGVIENMSTHICSECGHQEPLFGEGGGARLAQATDMTLLGQLPLKLAIRQAVDRGCPTVVAQPDSAEAKLYCQIAVRTAAHLAMQARNYAVKFGSVVVE